MTELTVFQETHCATAPELIEALRATRPSATLFRGVSDANFGLVPSLFRTGGWKRLRELNGPFRTHGTEIDSAPAVSGDEWNRLFIEFEVLAKRFFQISNRNSRLDLDMPDEVFELLDRRTQRSAIFQEFGLKGVKSKIPHKTLVSFYALMQHQGLPTPLLDWTENLLTACFFAADEADNRLGDHIAVFALNRCLLDMMSWPQFAQGLGPLHLPRLHFPRYRGNANLYAQAGAMSYVVNPGFATAGPPVACIFDLRQALEALLGHFGNSQLRGQLEGLASVCSPVLQKFTLPREAVPDLRRRLRDFGVTPSTIYPGFDGVRREIEGPWPAD